MEDRYEKQKFAKYQKIACGCMGLALLPFVLVFGINLYLNISKKRDLKAFSERLVSLGAPEHSEAISYHNENSEGGGNAGFPNYLSAILFRIPADKFDRKQIEDYFTSSPLEPPECVGKYKPTPSVFIYSEDEKEFNIHDEAEMLTNRTLFENIQKDEENYAYYVVHMNCMSPHFIFYGI